jgi:hypothetical protein
MKGIYRATRDTFIHFPSWGGRSLVACQAPMLGFNGWIGHPGHGEDAEIPAEYTQRLQRLTRPPDAVICFLAEALFPDGTATAIIWENMVVELPKMTTRTSYSAWTICRVASRDALLELSFHNGPIQH